MLLGGMGDGEFHQFLGAMLLGSDAPELANDRNARAQPQARMQKRRRLPRCHLTDGTLLPSPTQAGQAGRSACLNRAHLFTCSMCVRPSSPQSRAKGVIHKKHSFVSNLFLTYNNQWIPHFTFSVQLHELAASRPSHAV